MTPRQSTGRPVIARCGRLEGQLPFSNDSTQQAASTNAALAPVQQQIAQLSAQLAALPPGSPAQSALQAQYQALVQSVTTRQLAQVNQLNVVAPARAASAPISPAPVRNAV